MPGLTPHPDPPFGPGQGAPIPVARPAPAPMTAPRPPGTPIPQPRPVVSAGSSGQFAPPGTPQPARPDGPPVAPAPSGIPVARAPGAPGTDAGSPKIRALEQKLGGGRHEDSWQRSPNATGTGAIHVKSFHCKLTGDALENIDRQINEWLDAHPQYEVKFVSSTVGEWTGKLKEPNLILQLWV